MCPVTHSLLLAMFTSALVHITHPLFAPPDLPLWHTFTHTHTRPRTPQHTWVCSWEYRQARPLSLQYLCAFCSCAFNLEKGKWFNRIQLLHNLLLFSAHVIAIAVLTAIAICNVTRINIISSSIPKINEIFKVFCLFWWLWPVNENPRFSFTEIFWHCTFQPTEKYVSALYSAA